MINQRRYFCMGLPEYLPHVLQLGKPGQKEPENLTKTDDLLQLETS